MRVSEDCLKCAERVRLSTSIASSLRFNAAKQETLIRDNLWIRKQFSYLICLLDITVNLIREFRITNSKTALIVTFGRLEQGKQTPGINATGIN